MDEKDIDTMLAGKQDLARKSYEVANALRELLDALKDQTQDGKPYPQSPRVNMKRSQARKALEAFFAEVE